MSGLMRITIEQALERLDLMKANTVPWEQKVRWLSDLDMMAWHEIYMTHEGTPPESSFSGYSQDTGHETLLLIPEPHTEVYTHYLWAKIDLVTGESVEYAQEKALYNAAYQTFGDAWRRTHMPKRKRQHISF